LYSLSSARLMRYSNVLADSPLNEGMSAVRGNQNTIFREVSIRGTYRLEDKLAAIRLLSKSGGNNSRLCWPQEELPRTNAVITRENQNGFRKYHFVMRVIILQYRRRSYQSRQHPSKNHRAARTRKRGTCRVAITCSQARPVRSSK